MSIHLGEDETFKNQLSVSVRLPTPDLEGTSKRQACPHFNYYRFKMSRGMSGPFKSKGYRQKSTVKFLSLCLAFAIHFREILGEFRSH